MKTAEEGERERQLYTRCRGIQRVCVGVWVCGEWDSRASLPFKWDLHSDECVPSGAGSSAAVDACEVAGQARVNKS